MHVLKTYKIKFDYLIGGRANGFNSNIRISAQEYLIPFYRSLNFVTVGEVYLEDDIPHIEMMHKD